MKTKTRNILTGAAIAVLLGGAFGGVGALGFAKGAAEEAAVTKSLTGFTCPGASVFIATDGSDTKQMRFQINLTAAQAAYAGEGKTAGVVVLPYDIYKANGVTALTKDTTGVATADVSALWEENAEGGYSSYAYLDTKLIPLGQENRMLVARGYIEDGENIYYTEEVKASMAYVAWQNYNKEEFSAYREVLKSYMGPYTLAYGTGENEKIGNLYYGDKITLPEKVGDYSVEAWYWDSVCTDKIVLDDYATGSMQIYYELKKVSVSGTITAPDGVDVTKTIIYANGKDTGATVETNGNFTIRLSINAAYDLTFENGDYIAFADGVEVSESGTEAVNVTLKKNTWLAGNYGSVASNNTPELNESGVYTVSGQDQLLLFPNTATSEAFEYIVQVSNVSRPKDKADSGYGVAVSDGKYVLSVFVYESNGGVIANLSTKAGSAYNAFYRNTLTNIRAGGAVKFVVSSDKIEFYAGADCLFSFTKESFITPLSSLWNIDSLTKNYKTAIAGFFAEGAKIACGISSGFNASVTATYTCAVAKYASVSGMISAAEGVDLTATTLKVDGISTPVTVQSDGSYTVMLTEGAHTLAFENGSRAATKEVTIVIGENIVNVTLIDGTWLAGNYGSVASNNTPELNESGVYTVSGQNQLMLFPNTATSKAFEYTVQVSNVSRPKADSGYGIAVSDGKYVLSVFVYESSGGVIANLSTKAGSAYNTFYRNTLTNIRSGGTVKFVVSSDKIEFYAGADCLFSFTKDAFTTSLTNLGWGDSLTKNYKTAIAGFFAEGAKIACGISSGFNASVTATYTCSITKN